MLFWSSLTALTRGPFARLLPLAALLFCAAQAFAQAGAAQAAADSAAASLSKPAEALNAEAEDANRNSQTDRAVKAAAPAENSSEAAANTPNRNAAGSEAQTASEPEAQTSSENGTQNAPSDSALAAAKERAVLDSVRNLIDSLSEASRERREAEESEEGEDGEDGGEADSTFVLGPGSRALERGKTGIEAIDTLPIYEWDVATDHNSLPLTMALSVLPGGGHFYTGHYVRGGFLLAIEAILAYEVFYNKAYQKDRRFEQAAPYRDSVAYYTSLMMKTTSYSELVSLQEKRERYANLVRNINDKKMEEEDLRKAEMAWLLGLHVYGMFDAYGIWVNNQGHSVEHRSMMRAFLWALIPGGGQFYNRDYGKAGLVYMGLFGAGVSIWTTQNLIEYYLERRRTMIGEDNDDEEERLSERITHYRKNRNQYIWGSVIIYLYSIGDAVVDAMLADFDSPLHLAILPVLEGGVQAAVGLDF